MEIKTIFSIYIVMKQMFSRFHRMTSILCLMILLLSGCRTYGGYGTEEATFNQIQESNAVFANDLDKARGELTKLKQAAQQNTGLSPYVADYEMLLEKHSHLVEAHAKLASTLSVSTGFIGQLTPSYRNLNRALGSIAADQAAMKGGYYRFASHLISDGSEQGMLESNVDRSRYQAVPPYYLAITHALDRKSVSAALNQSM